MQSAQVAQRVINHGFKVVLEALTPRGVVSGGVIELGFGEELVGYTHAGALRTFDAILRSARP